MQTRTVLAPLLLAFAALAIAETAPTPTPTPSPTAEPAPSATPPSVEVSWGLRIPLRDRVELNATRYRARGASGAVPCVFTLTPYISQNYHDRAMYFGANGYVFLTVDVRGRGNSEGEFTPLLQEARDAHDVVEWLARQDWCDGKVTMWGGSYAGYNQWAAAKEFPRGLATIVPVASPYAGLDFPMARNVAYSYDLQWLTLVAGRAAQDKLFGDQAYWVSVFREMYLKHRPFRELDRIAGMPSPHFQTWIAHPAVDAYWDAYNPTAAQYAKIDLPILSVTGHYDGDQPGALEHYRRHMAHATPAARARHYLVIGPWDHPGTRTPQAEVAGLTFGRASLVDMNALHKAWYDWTLKGGAKPEFLKDLVAFYVTGRDAEAWRYVGSLEAVTAAERSLFLDSDAGSANDAFASGRLAATPGVGEPDHWVYDPLDTSSSALADATDVPGLVDQRAVLANAGKILVYHGAPLTEPTDVAGFFRLDAWIAIDQRDTDFEAAVYEIEPDGRSVFLAADRLRARYRTDPRRAELVEPGRIERYAFDRFSFVARRLQQGSRLRLVLGPVNSMYDQKNYNGGGDVSAESGADARTVTVTLYHDAARPSALVVPIAAPGP